jgi:membrane fusion protein, copper/silver efflux system
MIRAKLCVLFLIWLAAAIGFTGAGCGRSPSDAKTSPQKYHCPMHPTYVSDRPGDCPICNMKLVPIKDDKAPAPSTSAPAKADDLAHIKPGQFYCPMDLNIVSNAPGLCPECHMKLVEKKEASGGHDEHGTTPVPGRVSIHLSPEKRQLIGLTLTKVEKRDLTRTVRTSALVEHDETRYARIAPRFAGWVRKLHVNFTGAPVEKGQPLFSAYSPELLSTGNDYLIAWRAARALKDDAPKAQKDATRTMLEAARLRLALFELGDEDIRALEQADQAGAEQQIHAPFSGHVVVKNAVEGRAFMAGETLFEIADLDHLWLRGSVHESDLPHVHVGQDAVIQFPQLDNRSFPAKVTFLYPHMDAQTRRGEIRLELDNPGHLLRPDMWANLDLVIKAGEKLTVPASALIDTGQRHVAFVEARDLHLEPREVRIGAKNDDYYEVLSGLKEGEQVVTRALFLVDSESQLKAAIAGMGAGGEHQH